MKIAWIRIKGFQQFEDTFLDFRDPATGKALDKICLIGRNGTGKSTILELLYRCLLQPGNDVYLEKEGINLWRGLCAIKIEIANESFIFILTGIVSPLESFNHAFLYRSELESLDNWFELAFETLQSGMAIAYFTSKSHIIVESPFHQYEDSFDNLIGLGHDDNDLLVYCPAESAKNNLININDVPDVNLNQALKMFQFLPFNHVISNQNISDFWRLLIFLLKKRENDRELYETEVANLDKSKKQLIEEFNVGNPDILKTISDLWNEILDKAGLRFDYENAKMPIQLTDNLHAYITSKIGERVNYNKLSTGIRNFIFRFGHIKTLYFNRGIKRGLLLVDEPENSLFPDFLLDIISRYEEVTTDKNGDRNTQMFFATHSPIIASQFKPEERIILEWDEDGSVKARKGISPEGDDPNDILYQDFGMTEIVSKKGQEVWRAYLDLKKQLSRVEDDGEKKKIAEKILEIGQKYKFVR
jgi:AAA15 family ATPase/GTPase